jgi:F0F1-type ATP synthase membrane subunit b/b'
MAVQTRFVDVKSGRRVRARPRPWLLVGGAALAALPLCAAPEAAWAAEDLKLFPENWTHVAINFAVLLVLIYPVHKWLLGPIARVLQERDEQTRGSLGQVGDLRGSSTEMTASLEAKLREARSAAQRARASALAKAEAQEKHILERAREDAGRTLGALRASIADELVSARKQLESQSTALGREVAAKLLGRAL